MRKLTILFLTAAMVLGLLAGCGNNQNSQSSNSKESSSSASAQESTASAVSQESQTQDQGTEENSLADQELVKLHLILFGDVTSRQEEFFKNEFHDAVLEELNIDLTTDILPWGDCDSTVYTMYATGEKFASVKGKVFQQAGRGYIAPITMEQIEANMPEYLAMRGKNGFECSKFNGTIYMIPFGSKIYSGSYQVFKVRKDILEELGYKASEVTTKEQLLEVFEAVHQAYPNMRVLGESHMMYTLMNDGMGLDGIFTTPAITPRGDLDVLYINEADEGFNPVSYYDSELFKELCHFARDLVEKGYMLTDEISDPGIAQADWQAGNCFAVYGFPSDLINLGSRPSSVPDAEVDLIKIGDKPLISTINYENGMSISAADAENVDRWLQLFNWMYKDEDHYNFCVYGVEGKDWEWNADHTSINRLVTDVFIDSSMMLADCYNHYSDGISEENIAKYEAMDQDSIMSKVSGYSIDWNDAVLMQYRPAWKAIYNEDVILLMRGYEDYDEKWPEIRKKMTDAGFDNVIKREQEMITEWYNSK